MFIRGYFRKRRLRKDASPVGTEFVPLRFVRSMAVVLDAAASKADVCAEDIAQFCRECGIRLHLLYIDQRKANAKYQMVTDPLKTILRKDLNWFGRPNLHKSAEVLSEPTDLYLCLCDSDIYCVRYLSSSVRARFKVGVKEYEGDPYNFVVSPVVTPDEFTDIEAVFLKIKDLLATVK
ncbi:MAG: hypothetical protein LUC24_01360 [Bacteroidales bacterium]|nr:hypothetical protein [Bacteroidales bacterium]